LKSKQRYQCVNCKRVFIGEIRLDPQIILEEYLIGEQIYSQLKDKYSCSVKTIQRKIDQAKTIVNSTFSNKVNITVTTGNISRLISGLSKGRMTL